MMDTRLSSSGDVPVLGKETPLVWLLTGFRAGDRAQMVALADALGWPFTIKRFAYRSTEFITNIILGLQLAGIDWRRSDKLSPPWPDLVITAGRRNEPLARWIKAQSNGHTKIVHLGRPWSKIDAFDLVVTTPQYNVPALPNVLQIDLPLHGVTEALLQTAARQWRDSFFSLPRPWIGVLVGGNSPPYFFDPPMARRLAQEASELVRTHGGALLVATSPRTDAAAADALQAAIHVPHQFYRWSAAAETNPYLGYLALADKLIVTGDSMSMVAEASVTGKPLYLFDLGYGWTKMSESTDDVVEDVMVPRPFRPKRLLHWFLAHILPPRIRRDVRKILRALVAKKRAVWLGESEVSMNPVPPTDLARTVARVRELFGKRDH